MKKKSLKVRVLNVLRRLFQLRPVEAWLARQTMGKRPDQFICKFVPNPYQYEQRAIRDIHRHGIRLCVDLSDYIGHYYYFGFRDDAQQNLFSLCKSDFNVLDVGANIGFTTLKFARQITGGKVAGFEPDPFNFAASCHNLTLNNFQHATVLNYGLGSEEAILTLEVRTPGNRGGNRIRQGSANEDVKVPVRRLDSVFPELGMKTVELIKIDVEGYELRVLTGAEQTLKKYRPVLFIEIDDDNLIDQGDSAASLIDFLRQLGYRSFCNAENWRPIELGFDFSHCHFDIIVQ